MYSIRTSSTKEWNDAASVGGLGTNVSPYSESAFEIGHYSENEIGWLIWIVNVCINLEADWLFGCKKNPSSHSFFSIDTLVSSQ